MTDARPVSAYTAAEWMSVGLVDKLVPLADYERVREERDNAVIAINALNRVPPENVAVSSNHQLPADLSTAWAELERLRAENTQAQNGLDSLKGAHESLRERFAKACSEVTQRDSEIERLRSQLREWIAANGPGGWIDDLRKRSATPGFHGLRAALAN